LLDIWENKSEHQANKKKKVYIGCTKKSRRQTMHKSHASAALSSSRLLEHSPQNTLFLQVKSILQLILPPGDQLQLSPQTEVGSHLNITAIPTTIGSGRGKTTVSFWSLSFFTPVTFLLHLNYFFNQILTAPSWEWPKLSPQTEVGPPPTLLPSKHH
jgi:hypothetical protein